MSNKLSFETLRNANLARIPRFKDARGNFSHSKPDGSDWSKAEWMQAVLGELGELANLMKKVRRGDFTEESVRTEIGYELADVITYIDILASQYGFDLGELVRQKFNMVSDRVDAGIKIVGDEMIDECPQEYYER